MKNQARWIDPRFMAAFQGLNQSPKFGAGFDRMTPSGDTLKRMLDLKAAKKRMALAAVSAPTNKPMSWRPVAPGYRPPGGVTAPDRPSIPERKQYPPMLPQVGPSAMPQGGPPMLPQGAGPMQLNTGPRPLPAPMQLNTGPSQGGPLQAPMQLNVAPPTQPRDVPLPPSIAPQGGMPGPGPEMAGGQPAQSGAPQEMRAGGKIRQWLQDNPAQVHTLAAGLMNGNLGDAFSRMPAAIQSDRAVEEGPSTPTMTEFRQYKKDGGEGDWMQYLGEVARTKAGSTGRKTAMSGDGSLRYLDNGAQVFPDVQPRGDWGKQGHYFQGIDDDGESYIGMGVVGTNPDGSPVFRGLNTDGMNILTPTHTSNLGNYFSTENRAGIEVSRRKINIAEAAAEAIEGKATGDARTRLKSMEANLPGLQDFVVGLKEDAKTATYTAFGRWTDNVSKELGRLPDKGARARTRYIAKIDTQVLPLLRETFGAAFTEKEGEALKHTLGSPDVTPAEKIDIIEVFMAGKIREMEAEARRAEAEDPSLSDPWGLRPPTNGGL